MLEIISRFVANPKWLIYVPPKMSPTETSDREGYLEYPDEALEYFRREGVASVVCQEKHMGSRAVVIVCRDETAARRPQRNGCRFQVPSRSLAPNATITTRQPSVRVARHSVGIGKRYATYPANRRARAALTYSECGACRDWTG